MGPLTNVTIMKSRKSYTSWIGALHWLHWLVLGLSVVVIFFAWYSSRAQVEARVEESFDREVNQAMELVRERMAKYEEALWGGVAAIQAQDGDISQGSWKIFADNLQIDLRYPGINGIGVVHYVPPDALDLYLEQQRETRPDFSIHPSHSGNEYWPVTYIEPVGANLAAVGLDMAHETNRFTAAKKARDLGHAQITGPIILVQDEKQTPGFLFYAPFYKGGSYETIEDRQAQFTGMVYAPFIVQKLMEGALDKTKRNVAIAIRDGDDVLYNEHLRVEADYDPNPLFQRTIEVDLYGRNWAFDVRSDLFFRAEAENNQPLVILIGGILIDGLLLVLFIMLGNNNQRVRTYADQLSQTNKELEYFTHIAAHDLRSPLRRIESITGFLQDDLGPDAPGEKAGMINMMNVSVQKMRDLVDDFQDLAKVSAPITSPPSQINLNNLVGELIVQLEDQIEATETEIEIAPLPTVKGHEMLLRQLFTNLFENALKYSEGSGNDLSVSFDSRHDLLRVENSGASIPADSIDLVFEPFKRLSKDQAGSGLGLHICRKIVERHNGAIWMESDDSHVSVVFSLNAA